MLGFLKNFNDSSIYILSSLVFVIVVASYRYYENIYRYWDRRGVKGVRPLPLVSDFYELLFKNRAQLVVERTKKYGKIHGIFFTGKPRLMVADPEVLRQICIKDFDAFQNHEINDWHNKYQRNFLVWLQDDHWKRVRAMMSPTFTSGKIKRMYKLMDACADDLVDNFREQFEDKQKQKKFAIVDLYETYSMYTLDGITTCCYGIKLKRESNETDAPKVSSRNNLMRECLEVIRFDLTRILVTLTLPAFLLKWIGFELNPENKMNMLVERLEKLIEMRHLQANKYDDLLQMLVDAKLDDKLELNELDKAENHHAGLTHESLIKDQEALQASVLGHSQEHKKPQPAAYKLTDLEILSEAAFLLFAGFDTTRTSLSTITYLLAHHQDIQQRLYEELKKIAQFNETPIGKQLVFDYEQLTSCQYLDAVISESLRYFGPVIFTDRRADRDYFIKKYNIHVPKGSLLFLGIHSVHNDPDYWHEPETFNPERFMPGQREKIVPGSYAPFSMGPRHCIGMRFSLTETKLGLAKVIMNFEFEPAPGTKYPPEPSAAIGLSHIKDCRVRVFARKLY